MPSPSKNKHSQHSITPGLTAGEEGMKAASVAMEADIKLANIEVGKFAGFHKDIPLRDGVTAVPHLTITQGPRRTLRVVGIVLATAEKPHRILAGVDAYSTAVHLAKEAMASSIFLTTWLMPSSAIKTEFWGTWHLWESALATQSTPDRSALATRLIGIGHVSVKSKNLKHLGSVFGLSTRSLKRFRQNQNASRSYRRKDVSTSTITDTNGVTADSSCSVSPDITPDTCTTATDTTESPDTQGEPQS